MHASRWVVVLGAAILASCASAPVSLTPAPASSTPALASPTPETPTPATSAPSSSLDVTEKDNGRAFTVHLGATIEVTLGPPGSPYRWSEVTSSDASVLRRTASLLQGGGSSATFVVAGSGSATLSASEDPVCRPACGAPSKLWRVVVVAA